MQITAVRPFPPSAWPRVWEWMQAFKGRVLDDFAPADLDAFVALQLRAAAHETTWGIAADGDLCGVVSATLINGRVAVVHVVFKKAFWGRHVTLPALAAIADQLFTAGVAKIQATLFADNHGMRALLLDSGAVKEGTLRGHTLRGGEPADIDLFAIFKEPFYERIHEFDNVAGRGPVRGREPDGASAGSGSGGGAGQLGDEPGPRDARVFARPDRAAEPTLPVARE